MSINPQYFTLSFRLTHFYSAPFKVDVMAGTQQKEAWAITDYQNQKILLDELSHLPKGSRHVK